MDMGKQVLILVKNRFHGEGVFKFKNEIYDGEFFNININDSGGRDTGFKSK